MNIKKNKFALAALACPFIVTFAIIIIWFLILLQQNLQSGGASKLIGLAFPLLMHFGLIMNGLLVTIFSFLAFKREKKIILPILSLIISFTPIIYLLVRNMVID